MIEVWVCLGVALAIANILLENNFKYRTKLDWNSETSQGSKSQNENEIWIISYCDATAFVRKEIEGR